MRYSALPLHALVLVVPVIHLLIAPYTKVEESFTLHAARDVLEHGFFSQHAIEQYDHRTFPGAVPRSFIPSIVWAAISWPLLSIGRRIGWITRGLDEQILLRAVLALTNGLSVIRLSQALGRRTRDRSTVIFFLGLSVGQFHTMFYAGRPLPNFMALPIVNLALGYLVESQVRPSETTGDPSRTSRAIILLSLASSIIRSELALLLGPLALYLLLVRREPLTRLVAAGFIGGAGGALASTLVDSLFWARWTWPEMEAVVFNVVQGKSEAWGVSPWYSYIVVHLPKITLFSLPLAIYALVSGAGSGFRGMTMTGIVSLVGGMSLLGHKEWRFIVYAVPLFNVLAATGASRIWDRAINRKSIVDKLGGLILIGGLLANVMVTIGLTFVSVNNYPGGEAIEALKRIGATSGRSDLRVFLPPSVLQTGASRYTFEQPDDALPRWDFDRTESDSLETSSQIWSAGFDYTVTDDVESFLEDEESAWDVVQSIESFGGISLKPSPRVRWSPRLWILAREKTSATTNVQDLL